MKVYLAHDPSAGDSGMDLLIRIHDDGTGDFATREGRNRRWVTWSPPIALTVEVVGMSTSVYAVTCPRCGSAAGVPCRERYCKNGYRDCAFAICSRIRDMEEPHVARVAAAEVSS